MRRRSKQKTFRELFGSHANSLTPGVVFRAGGAVYTSEISGLPISTQLTPTRLLSYLDSTTGDGYDAILDRFEELVTLLALGSIESGSMSVRIERVTPEKMQFRFHYSIAGKADIFPGLIVQKDGTGVQKRQQ